MTEPRWKQRYRAATLTLPRWGVDQPDRLVYASNLSGSWQVHAWDRLAGTHRQVSEHPTGVVAGTLTPDGGGVVWFEDDKGNEIGHWKLQPFAGGDAAPLLPGVGPAWSAGLALGPKGRVALGLADRDGFRVRVGELGGDSVELYRHEQTVDLATPSTPSPSRRCLATAAWRCCTSAPGGCARRSGTRSPGPAPTWRSSCPARWRWPTGGPTAARCCWSTPTWAATSCTGCACRTGRSSGSSTSPARSRGRASGPTARSGTAGRPGRSRPRCGPSAPATRCCARQGRAPPPVSRTRAGRSPTRWASRCTASLRSRPAAAPPRR